MQQQTERAEQEAKLRQEVSPKHLLPQFYRKMNFGKVSFTFKCLFVWLTRRFSCSRSRSSCRCTRRNKIVLKLRQILYSRFVYCRYIYKQERWCGVVFFFFVACTSLNHLWKTVYCDIEVLFFSSPFSCSVKRTQPSHCSESSWAVWIRALLESKTQCHQDCRSPVGSFR